MWAAGVLGTVLAMAQPGYAADAVFHLLTWDNTDATPELPTAVGRKPSAANAASDWLPFTGDDQVPGATNNPLGGLSHNFADLTGVGGSLFHMAPSLTGSISLQFGSTGPGAWDVTATNLSYTGQANAATFMNQSLVTPQSAAAQNPTYNVDGVGNSGTWHAADAGNWAIEYDLDFIFEPVMNGVPQGTAVAFDDKSQQGYLLPVSLLTSAGLSSLSLNDPANFYPDNYDFKTYLLAEIKPRLPQDATYLLVTQMSKVIPDFVAQGFLLQPNGLVGNTTFAYTTSAIPEPGSAVLALLAGAGLMGRRRRSA